MSNHFKTQQEIWKYVADGGAVVSKMGTIIKFVNGKLNLQSDFTIIEHWSPYIEPVAEIESLRAEMQSEIDDLKHRLSSLEQSKAINLMHAKLAKQAAVIEKMKKAMLDTINQRTRGYPTWQEWEKIWVSNNEALAEVSKMMEGGING